MAVSRISVALAETRGRDKYGRGRDKWPFHIFCTMNIAAVELFSAAGSDFLAFPGFRGRDKWPFHTFCGEIIFPSRKR